MSLWPRVKPWSTDCRPESRNAFQAVARAAQAALGWELAVYPKPGLVSFVDSGSHADMDAATFVASIRVVAPAVARLGRAAAAGATLAGLRRLGLAAEKRMLTATGGVNTHKGAIFTLGLLAAAHGLLAPNGGAVPAWSLCRTVGARFGEALLTSYPSSPVTAGERLHLTYGVGGARREAALGFPCLIRHGLPALRQALAAGLPPNDAGVQVFFAILAQVEDTTLLSRGGGNGLAFARSRARSFLAAGGATAPGWFQEARALHQDFVARNLSAGGAADLLAATLFCHFLEEGPWPVSPY